jgi:hypothetical protein
MGKHCSHLSDKNKDVAKVGHPVLHFEEDLFPVENPHGNEAERGEGDRIGKRGPAGIGDMRKRVKECPGNQVGMQAVRVADVNVVEDPGINSLNM